MTAPTFRGSRTPTALARATASGAASGNGTHYLDGAAFMMQAMHPVIGEVTGKYSAAFQGDPAGRAIRSVDSVLRWIYGGTEAVAEGNRVRAFTDTGFDPLGQNRDADGNVLALRQQLSPGTIRKLAERKGIAIQESAASAAASQEHVKRKSLLGLLDRAAAGKVRSDDAARSAGGEVTSD